MACTNENVRTLLDRMEDIVADEALLLDIVEDHQSHQSEGGLWGGVESRSMDSTTGIMPVDDAPMDADEVLWRNSQWSEACTHSERGLGYTCGLWDLFHILSIGASLHSHQLYGFRSGYLTGSQHVAETIKRFIASFLACDVCRWNFVSSFENCGHDHCHRLAPVMPSLTLDSTQEKELALWLWETHNSVNARLMKENAEREDREVTEKELLAATFPSREMCFECWLDDKMERHDKDAVFAFLQDRYWYEIRSVFVCLNHSESLTANPLVYRVPGPRTMRRTRPLTQKSKKDTREAHTLASSRYRSFRWQSS